VSNALLRSRSHAAAQVPQGRRPEVNLSKSGDGGRPLADIQQRLQPQPRFQREVVVALIDWLLSGRNPDVSLHFRQETTQPLNWTLCFILSDVFYRTLDKGLIEWAS